MIPFGKKSRLQLQRKIDPPSFFSSKKKSKSESRRNSKKKEEEDESELEEIPSKSPFGDGRRNNKKERRKSKVSKKTSDDDDDDESISSSVTSTEDDKGKGKEEEKIMKPRARKEKIPKKLFAEGGRGDELESEESFSSESEEDRQEAQSKKLKSSGGGGGGDIDENVTSQREKTTAAEIINQGHGSFFISHPRKESVWRTEVVKKGKVTLKSKDEWDSWTKMLFYPKSTEVPLKEKLGSDSFSPCDLAEEGFFIENKISVASKNKNRFENRLIEEKDFKWFGPDGELESYLSYPYLKKEGCINMTHFDHSGFSKRFSNKVIFAPARLDPSQEFQVNLNMSYELLVDIGHLQFLHHSLFSKENVIASKLELTFQEYLQRIDLGNTERAEYRLKAIKEAIIHTKSEIKSHEQKLSFEEEEKVGEESSKLQEQVDQLKERLENYYEEKRKTKKIRDQSLFEDNKIMGLILEYWKDLKMIREDQGFANTMLKLNINKIQGEVGIDGDAKLILDLVRNPSLISSGRVELKYSSKEARRRRYLSKTKIEIRIYFNGKEVYKIPGAALNLSSLDFSVFIGKTIPIQIKEWPSSLHLEIYEIGRTAVRNHVAEVNLWIPDSNSSIERSQIQRVEFASSDIIRTNSVGVGSGIPFQILENTYPGVFTNGYVTTRIGWSTDKKGKILCPKGFKNSDYSMESKKNEEEEESQNQKWSTFDPNNPQNSKWLKTDHARELSKSKIEIKKKTSLIPLDEDEMDEEFSLDKMLEEHDFCSMDVIENSLRLKFLQLRDEEVPEFRYLKMIGPTDKSVPIKILEKYEKRLKEDQRKKFGDEWNNGFSSSKLPGRKRMATDDPIYEINRLERIKEFRLNVLKLFENYQKTITFESLVLEEQIPDIGTLGLNIMSLFQPKRPLRPARKERKRVVAHNIVDIEVSLIVNIVRAFNLPIRKDSNDASEFTSEALTGINLGPTNKKRGGGGGTNTSIVKPFVEVVFLRKATRTTTALGSNPTWNQELQIQLKSAEEKTDIEAISEMDEMIYLLLYDEVSIDLLEDDRKRDTDIHQRMEKRWLGSISIPFSTLFTNGRIEGTFKVNSPPVLLGYEAQGITSHFGPLGHVMGAEFLKEPSANRLPLSNPKNAFLTLFMTIQPDLPIPEPANEEDISGSESPDLIAHTKFWKKLYEKRFPNRTIFPFTMTDGDIILYTRFLHPIQPPEIFLKKDEDLINIMEDLAHYVSLFPTVKDAALGIKDYSLIFTSDVFVMTHKGGGIEDHAVLLACYFLYLKVPCWIVQGNAIPDGRASYVFTCFKGVADLKIKNSFKNAQLIWNPCSGEHYSANDSFCPLQKVWALVGPLNIWGNVSEDQRPHQIDFDINKAKNWNPLFSKSVHESKLFTIQPTSIKYKDADQIQGQSLAQRIERYLKDKFMRWRKGSKTSWNRYCSAILRRMLPGLEESLSSSKYEMSTGSFVGGNPDDSGQSDQESQSPYSMKEEHLRELREIIMAYQMTGFPIQTAYSNMESISELVMSTGLQRIESPNVEFALACHVKSYPASIYSVWVYIAALHKRK